MFDSAWRAKTTSKAHRLRWLSKQLHSVFMLSLVEPRWLKGTLLCTVSKDFLGKVETFWLIGTLTCDSDARSTGASKPGSCPVFNAWIRSYDRCCQKTKPCFVTLRTFFSFLFPLSTIFRPEKSFKCHKTWFRRLVSWFVMSCTDILILIL